MNNNAGSLAQCIDHKPNQQKLTNSSYRKFATVNTQVMKMKINISVIALTVSSLSFSTEARVGIQRNLVGTSADVESSVESGTISVLKNTSLQVSEQEEEKLPPANAVEANDQDRPKPLPSLDVVMHQDAPSHGMYVEGGSARMRSFCARHNHLGSNSGCEQHQSLRGSRVKEATKSSGEKVPASYLQKRVNEAKLHQNQKRQGQTEKESYLQKHVNEAKVLNQNQTRQRQSEKYSNGK